MGLLTKLVAAAKNQVDKFKAGESEHGAVHDAHTAFADATAALIDELDARITATEKLIASLTANKQAGAVDQPDKTSKSKKAAAAEEEA